MDPAKVRQAMTIWGVNSPKIVLGMKKKGRPRPEDFYLYHHPHTSNTTPRLASTSFTPWGRWDSNPKKGDSVRKLDTNYSEPAHIVPASLRLVAGMKVLYVRWSVILAHPGIEVRGEVQKHPHCHVNSYHRLDLATTPSHHGERHQ